MPSLFGEAKVPEGVYEYTERLTFYFSEAPALSDESTPAGATWATTLNTLLELEQTDTVWWCSTHDNPLKASLFVDWKTVHGREEFHIGDSFKSLRASWDAITSKPVQSDFCVFGARGRRSLNTGRDVALSKGHETANVLFTFRFPQETISRSDFETDWDRAIWEFSHAAMRSPGGVAASGCALGWGLPRNSYWAGFRFTTIDAMKSFLQSERGLATCGRLREFDHGNVKVEYLADCRTYNQGWLGHVDKTWLPDPGVSAMFARLRAQNQEFESKHGVSMSDVMRGVHRPT